MKWLLMVSFYVSLVSGAFGQEWPDSLYVNHDSIFYLNNNKPFTGILNLYVKSLGKKKIRSSTFYRKGLKDSFEIKYCANGSIYRIEFFKGHRLDSFGWNKNGSLKFTYTFNTYIISECYKGLLVDSVEVIYNKNGKTYFRRDFLGGKKLDSFGYYKNGRLRCSYFYKDNIPDGPFRYYYNDNYNSEKEYGIYVSGKLSDSLTFYYPKKFDIKQNKLIQYSEAKEYFKKGKLDQWTMYWDKKGRLRLAYLYDNGIFIKGYDYNTNGKITGVYGPSK